MSATMRDRVYRISGWGTTSDWVVTRRERNGCVHLSSRSLGTTITVHESKLEMVVADRNESPSLFLATADPTSHGVGSGSALSARALPTSSGESRGQPLARNTDPDTAHLAAATARGAAAANRLKVLLAHRDAGERGLTGWELEQATQTPYETLGPRRPSLETDGLIVATNERRPNGRGNLERVYRVTEAGRITADRAEA